MSYSLPKPIGQITGYINILNNEPLDATVPFEPIVKPKRKKDSLSEHLKSVAKSLKHGGDGKDIEVRTKQYVCSAFHFFFAAERDFFIVERHRSRLFRETMKFLEELQHKVSVNRTLFDIALVYGHVRLVLVAFFIHGRRIVISNICWGWHGKIINICPR